MGTRLYVGNVSDRVRERDLEEFFQKFGRLRDVVLKPGYAFVELDESHEAEDAIHYMNGRELLGQKVSVQMVRNPPKGREADRTSGTRYLVEQYGYRHADHRFNNYNRYGYRGDYYRRRSPRHRSPRARSPRSPRRDDYRPIQTRWRVFVENLSTRVTWQILKDFMRQAGEVVYSDANTRHDREGVVCYTNETDMRRAVVELNGKELEGRVVKLSHARMDSRSRSRSRSRSQPRSRSVSRGRRRRSRSRSGSRHRRSRTRSPVDRRSRSVTRERSGSRTPNGKAEKRSRPHSRTPSENGRAKGNGAT